MARKFSTHCASLATLTEQLGEALLRASVMGVGGGCNRLLVNKLRHDGIQLGRQAALALVRSHRIGKLAE